MDQVPVIDLEPLLAGTPNGQAVVARQIGAAARDIGFFAVANHGVSAGLVSDVFAAAQTFFAQPEARKADVAMERSPHYLGFAFHFNWLVFGSSE